MIFRLKRVLGKGVGQVINPTDMLSSVQARFLMENSGRSSFFVLNCSFQAGVVPACTLYLNAKAGWVALIPVPTKFTEGFV